MTKQQTSAKHVAQNLIKEHGQTFADEIGFRVSNKPAGLYKLLVASILYSARISSEKATAAARAIFDAGWTTPDKLAESTWRQRVTVLNRSGYARYDESTSRMLGDTVELLISKYDGDLRNLRNQAEHDPEAERRLLKEFKGLGDTGVDIFFREVQPVWSELQPFFDKTALKAAEAIDLPKDPQRLAQLVTKKDLSRFAAGLVRVGRTKKIKQLAEELKKSA